MIAQGSICGKRLSVVSKNGRLAIEAPYPRKAEYRRSKSVCWKYGKDKEQAITISQNRR
jgi:hypothetical protein